MNRNKFETIDDAIILAWSQHAMEDLKSNAERLGEPLLNKYITIYDNIYQPMIVYYQSYLELLNNEQLGSILVDNISQNYNRFIEFAMNFENFIGEQYQLDKYPFYAYALVLVDDKQNEKDGRKRNYYLPFEYVNSYYFDGKYDKDNIPDVVVDISGKMYISKRDLRNLLTK